MGVKRCLLFLGRMISLRCLFEQSLGCKTNSVRKKDKIQIKFNLAWVDKVPLAFFVGFFAMVVEAVVDWLCAEEETPRRGWSVKR